MTEDEMTAQAFDEYADDLEREAEELRRKASILRFGVGYSHLRSKQEQKTGTVA